MNDGRDYDLTVQFIDLKGNKKWVRTKSRAVKNREGEVIRIIGSVRDVTEEVEREAQLRRNVEKFEKLVHSFDDIVFTLDSEGRHTALYGAWSDEIDTDFLIGKDAIEIFGEERGRVHLDAVKQVLQTRRPLSYEWSVEKDQEAKTYYHTRLNLLEHGGRTDILGVSRNITSEVNFRQEINRTHERLELALEAMKAGTWDWDLRTDELIINDWWAKMLGYDLKELEFHIDTWKNLMHPTDLKSTVRLINELRDDESPYFETRIRMQHKKGHWVWINDRGKIVERDEMGNPIRLSGTHIDISERVKAEKALQLSEKKYRNLFERSSDPSLVFFGNTIVDCNRAAIKFLGYEKKHDLVGKTPVDISPEKQPDGTLSEVRQQEILNKTEQNESQRFEWVHKKKDGTPVHVEVVITMLPEQSGREQMYVVWRDISDRKIAEQKVIESLREKEALLSEIHHRVKNNLAVISGLLQLQIYSAKDDAVADILNSSINRIKSMALIHEQLYQSENFSDISLKENILKQTESIFDVFDDEYSTDIDLQLDLDDVSIGINQAMPVGLLVNEILINSLKHAFKGRENGKVYINLKQIDERVILNISDNGVGFDSENRDPSSLGHTLIDTFISQLEADVELSTIDGTSYNISFKVNDQNGSVVSRNV
nr:PAS domain S-box protein [Rhodohalobacter halophilus]